MLDESLADRHTIVFMDNAQCSSYQGLTDTPVHCINSSDEQTADKNVWTLAISGVACPK